jgi:peptidoglycan hydrolase CwlO-like protein
VAQAKLLKEMEASTKSTRTKLEQMHTDVDRVKSLQRNNQKDIQDLEAQIIKLNQVVEERKQQILARL